MDREESDLYGLALDEFIPARTELERRLRREGDRTRAAAVKKLPKPTVAAWAVNQASRTQPKSRRELLESSAALREAQERLIAGEGSAAELEKAAGAQRAAIDSLVDAASGLLSSDGKALGDTILARVRETLAAVAADGDLAALVETGTLDRERRPAGLGFGFGSPAPDDTDPAPRRTAHGKKGGTRAGRTPRASGDAKAAKRDAKAAKQRERDLRAARERVKAARGAEKESARVRKAAERESKKAAAGLERAEAARADARERARAANDELDSASAAAERAASARASAEAELEELG
ncbi:MAG: hypothetical protein QOE06_401 [Thermoleophilaceae bacterium]|nr:hypothetical protein [Thermoleophilaceae bacterium]